MYYVIAKYIKTYSDYYKPYYKLSILERFDCRNGIAEPIWRDANMQSNIMLVHAYDPKKDLAYWRTNKRYGEQFTNAFVMTLYEAMNIENFNKEI